MEIFPNFRGENKKCLSCHHPDQGLFLEASQKYESPTGLEMPGLSVLGGSSHDGRIRGNDDHGDRK